MNSLKIYLLLAFALCAGTTGVLGQQIRFNKTFGTVDADAAFTIHNTDSGYVAIGFSVYIDSLYKFGPRVVFLDYNGAIQADKHLIMDDAGIYRAQNDETEQLQDGYISCVGYRDTIETDENEADIIFIRYNSYGDTIWTRVYSFNDFDTAFGVEQTNDKGYVGAGYSYTSYSPDIACGRLFKIDSLGNLLWSKTYNCDYFSFLGTVMTLDDGSIVAGGEIQEDNQFSYSKSLVIKTDSLGNLIWSKELGGSFDEFNVSVTKSNDGNILVTGSYCLSQFEGPPLGYCDKQKLYMAKLDAIDGHIIWDKMYGDTTIGALLSCEELPNGDIIAVGTYRKQFSPNTPYKTLGCLLKTNSLGDSLWMRTYYYNTPDSVIPNQNFLTSVKQTPDGGYVSCGQVSSIGIPQDSWIIKTDANGCIDMSCVNGVEELDDEDFRLFVYPNPANDYVSIDLPITHNKAILQIYTIEGRLVKTESINGGGLQNFSLTDLPNGVYQLIVSASNGKLLGREKLVVVR